jgi:hypothetical protein
MIAIGEWLWVLLLIIISYCYPIAIIAMIPEKVQDTP